MTYPRKIAGNWIQNGRMGKKIAGRTGKNVGEPSKNRPKSDAKRGKSKKKVGFTGQKRVRFLEKSPEIRFETGKSGKSRDSGVKKVGWGRGEKIGFTADFAML